jgi:hypothetical protein
MSAPHHAGVLDLKRFAGLLACSQMISLLTVDVTQIGQGPGGPPSVSCVSKGGKSTLIQLMRFRQVILFLRYVAQPIDGPGDAAAIAEFLENFLRLAQRPSSAQTVAADLGHIGEVMKATRNCQSVREQAPARKMTRDHGNESLQFYVVARILRLPLTVALHRAGSIDRLSACRENMRITRGFRRAEKPSEETDNLTRCSSHRECCRFPHGNNPPASLFGPRQQGHQ